MDEPLPSHAIEVGRFRSVDEAKEHALVLIAVGIESRLDIETGAIVLRVGPDDVDRAEQELASYARERTVPAAPPAAERSLSDGILGVLVAWSVTVFLFSASRRGAFGLDWLEAGAAHARWIAEGEWWRVVTALGLHTDVGHLVSNLIAGAGFALLLTQSLGSGLAWLAIVLGGSLGNLLNAALRSPEHAAIGASTAVFAALGTLAGLACARRMGLDVRGHRLWVPIGAGVMLLAIVGVGGERTDVGAHFAGFGCGVAVGGVIATAGRRLPQSRHAQHVAAGAAGALVASAWLAALFSHA